MSRIFALLAMIAISCFGYAAPTSADQPPADVRELVSSVIPSVVSIYMRGLVPPEPSDSGRSVAAAPRIFEEVGSGFIVDPSGLIVTNRHVIKNAYEVYVTLFNGNRVQAHVLGEGTTFDLAIIKIDSDKPLPVVKLGNSDSLGRGDRVVAIGNPLGFKESVTAGIVSALGRDLGLSAYDDLIQTDAVINQGNSGGPMFNMNGEVVGINQAIYTTTKGAGSIGLGFAIPINQAKFLLTLVRKSGELRTGVGWLGAGADTLTPGMADAAGLGFASGSGVILSSVVADGPAAQAGLREGDIITRFGDHDIRDTSDLNRAVATSVDETVPLQMYRDGQPSAISVKVAEWPQQIWLTNNDATAPILNTTDALGLAFSATPGPDGPVIESIVDKSTAAAAEMHPGDVVRRIQSIAIRTPDEFQTALTELHNNGKKNVLVLLSNNSGQRWINLPLR